MNKEEKLLRESYNDLLEELSKKAKSRQDRKVLYEAAIYHLSVKGKIIRPLIMVNVNNDLENTYDKIEGFALALEMIHNFSLIHDDLPALDDDDYRRNQLAVHKKFGEDIGILSGDYLLTMAFEILTSKYYIDYGNSKNYMSAFSYLIHNTNDLGMLGGQIIDLDSHSINSLEELFTMYELKTSALFKSAFTIPAILLGMDHHKIDIFENLGKNFGLYFQIRDDIEDKEEDEKIKKITIYNFLDQTSINEYLETYKDKVLKGLEDLKLSNTKKTLEFIL